MLLTIACSAGASNYAFLDIASMNQYVDYFNLMAYDYAGSWSSDSGHDANLYASSSNPNSTPFNTNDAVAHFTSLVPANKVVLGMPLYGRSFTGTAGMGQPFSGVGSGSFEAGVWDYKALPQPGAIVTEDLTGVVGSSSYDSSQQLLISYDTPAVADVKRQYIQNKGLGGGMWWETSGDRNDSGSLITTVKRLKVVPDSRID